MISKEINEFEPLVNLLFELTKISSGVYDNEKAEPCLKMRWIPLWWASRSLSRTFLVILYNNFIYLLYNHYL